MIGWTVRLQPELGGGAIGLVWYIDVSVFRGSCFPCIHS